MRTGLALGLITLVASIAVASCGEGGTGVGSSPPQSPSCPTTVPAEGTTCPALQVCDYPQGAGFDDDLVAVCPFAGGTWDVHERAEAGVFTDAEIPEVTTDAAGDAEAGDAADADETTDAADTATTDATDASDDADAADAADATDTAVVDASDAG